MKNKKPNGFTLIEILAVVIIISIVLVLLVPTVFGVIERSKQNAYDLQVSNIKSAAKNYVTSKIKTLTPLKTTNGIAYITLNDLSDAGFIELPIKNPLTNDNFNPTTTYVMVTANANATYTYDYVDTSTSTSFNETYGGTLSEHPFSVLQTKDGGYIVGGYAASGDNDITDGNNGGNDYLVIKVSATGAMEWNRTYGGTLDDNMYYMIETSDNNYLLVGASKSTNGDLTEATTGGYDYWIVKINSTGDIIWDKTYGGTLDELVYGAIETLEGDFIIPGATLSNNGDITDGNAGERDVWVLKLDKNGNKIWDKTYGGTLTDSATNIEATQDGNYLIAAYSNSTNGDITDGNNGNYDYWLIKISTSGTILWNKTYGGDAIDYILDVLPSNNNDGYIVVGYSNSNNGDFTDGNNGGYDNWILKVSLTGQIVWAKSYGGSGDDLNRKIIRTPDGYLISGQTTSANGDITDGNNGDIDMWLYKINEAGTISTNKTFGGDLADSGNAVTATKDGGYIAISAAYSSNEDVTDCNYGGSEYWILKLKSDLTY